MADQVTNPTAGEAANQPGAGASDSGAPGSQYRPGMLVSVPHPGIPDDEGDQPGGPEPSEAKQPGPAKSGQESKATNLEDGGAGDSPGKEDGGQEQAGQDGQPFMVLDYKGRKVPVKDHDELVRMAQQGFDYTVKTQMLAPHLNDLRTLANLRANPTTAAQLEALLNGQALPGTGPAGGQAAGGQAPAKLPEIYVRDQQGNIMRDEDGQPMKADPTFVYALRDYVEALGLDKPAQAAMSPELASLATQVQVGKVASYVKQTYGRDDFTAAIPLIQHAMVSQGIRAGDPRDSPDTWVAIYSHLALTNQLPAAKAPGGDPNKDAGGAEEPTSKRKNMSETKVAAKSATPDNTGQSGKALDEAIGRAKQHGSMANWSQAVGLVISHPDLEQGA